MLREVLGYIAHQPSSWASMEQMASHAYTAKDDPSSSHRTIARLICQHRKSGTLLDVGCAEGYISKSLHDLGNHDFRITGLDVNPHSLEVARQYCERVVLCDLEEPIPLSDRFDVIVLADVIEHVRNPYRVLVRVRDLLEPNGILVLSVPNVANWTVRLSLLLGRYNYRPRGLLDRTHLRFFTRHSLFALVEEANLRVVHSEATPIPLPLLTPAFGPAGALHWVHKLNCGITWLRPSLFGYQFVTVLQPR